MKRNKPRKTNGASASLPVHTPPAEHQELTLILYSYKDWAPNEELGRASLALRELPPGREQALALQLRATGGAGVGGRCAALVGIPVSTGGRSCWLSCCCQQPLGFQAKEPGSCSQRACEPCAPHLLHLPARLPAAEQKHEEESRKLSGLDRLALAAARPFTKKGSDVCQLRLLVGGRCALFTWKAVRFEV